MHTSIGCQWAEGRQTQTPKKTRILLCLYVKEQKRLHINLNLKALETSQSYPNQSIEFSSESTNSLAADQILFFLCWHILWVRVRIRTIISIFLNGKMSNNLVLCPTSVSKHMPFKRKSTPNTEELLWIIPTPKADIIGLNHKAI